MKKLFIFMLMSGMVLSGCSNNKNEVTVEGPNSESNIEEDGKNNVIITMGTSSEPEEGFDPILGWGGGEHQHNPIIQSTLTKTNNELFIEYDLATEITTSEDGLLWTVKIRDDVYFTDGEKLNADDVALTYNLLKDSSSINDMSMLEEAKVIDNTTIEFVLKYPYSIFSHKMATVGIVPEHLYDESYGLNPIGSGPYKFVQWDRGQQVILEANENYYGDVAQIEELIVLFMDETASFAATKASEVDFSYTNSSYGINEVEGYGLLAVETLDNRGINLPTIPYTEINGVGYGNDFTSDVLVRRALNIGINRQEIIDYVLNGFGTMAYSVADNTPWFEESSIVEYDFEKANSLLEEAGWILEEDELRYKDGEVAYMKLIYPTSDKTRQEIAENVASQFRKLGIEVETEGAGWDTAYTRAYSSPLVWGWGTHSPIEVYNIYHTAKNGEYALYSPYLNEEADKYMDMAIESADEEQAYEYWKEAQKIVSHEGDIPWVWLVNVDHLYFVKDGLEVYEQKIHPHGQGWSALDSINLWYWKE